MLEGLLDFVFPYSCVGCGLYCSARQSIQLAWWCRACETAVQRQDRGIIRHIGDVDIHAAYRFTCEPVAGAIHALKYKGIAGAAELCARWAGDLLLELAAESDALCVIVPVPLHPRRQAERGFNQVALIGREISKLTGIPVDFDLVTRGRYTTPQAHSVREDRQSQLAGAFLARGPLSPETRYFVLDDVVTTGSTLIECVGALRAAGAKNVQGLAVATA